MMGRALRNVALSALLGVLIVSVLRGRPWLLGWAALILVLARLTLAWRPRSARVAYRLTPCLAIAAALGLALQALGVAVHGDLGRSAGFLPHANTAAATTVALWTLLAVCSAMMPSRGGRWWTIGRGLLVFGSCLSGLLLLAAGSRSLMFGLLFGIVVAAAARKPRTLGWRAWLPLGAAVATLGVGLLVSARLRPDVDSVLGSFERGPIFMAALEIAALSPWTGLGDGAWTRWAPSVEPSLPLAAAVHTHSVPLEALVGGGAIGLAALLVLLVLGARSLLARRAGDGALAGSALIVGVVALAVQGLVDLAVLYPGVYAPLALAMASWDVLSDVRPEARKERGHGEQGVERGSSGAVSR